MSPSSDQNLRRLSYGVPEGTLPPDFSVASPLAEIFRAQERIQVLPAERALFTQITHELSREALSEMYQKRQHALLVGPECSDALQQVMPELLEGMSPFYGDADVSLETVAGKVAALVQWAVPNASAHAASLLQEDIAQEASRFLAVTGQREIGLRLFCETEATIRALMEKIYAPDPTDAQRETARAIEHLGYHGAFVYHKDDFGINLIRSYAGPATLCISPDALSQDEAFEMVDAWTGHMFGDSGFAADIKASLEQGDRDLALHQFKHLLKVVWSHQVHCLGSGLEEVKAYEFPRFRSGIYFGDQEELEVGGEKLLMHARPMCYLTNSNAKRFSLILETGRRATGIRDVLMGCKSL